MTGLANGAEAYFRYAYKASLIGAAHQFELTDEGLSWQIGGKAGVWPYGDIAAIRLSYRPVSMQSRRFRADIEHANGDIAAIRLSYRPVSMQSRRFRADIEHANRQRIVILSTSWQTVALMAPQDHDYRAFITQLHQRMEKAESKARLIGGIGPNLYAAGIVLLALVATAIAGLLIRAIGTGEFIGALFLVGFAALFAWQVGGFIRRNRPRAYTFDRLPEALLP